MDGSNSEKGLFLVATAATIFVGIGYQVHRSNSSNSKETRPNEEQNEQPKQDPLRSSAEVHNFGGLSVIYDNYEPQESTEAAISWLISAPGKIILFGEHAVVHGKLCLATALNLRTVGKFTEKSLSTTKPKSQIHALSLELKDLRCNCWWTLEELEDFDRLLHEKKLDFEKDLTQIMSLIEEKLCRQFRLNPSSLKAATAFLYLFFYLKGSNQKIEKSLLVVFKSKLPVGAGLGSSASYNVCLTAGLLRFFRMGDPNSYASETSYSEEHLQTINKYAFQAERIMHGTPSGIDNTVSTFGKTVTLKKLPSLEITTLKNTLTIPLLLTDTKQPRDTKTLVAKVKEFCDRNPERGSTILEEIHSISNWCVNTFNQTTKLTPEITAQLDKNIDKNQALLCELGVGHATLDKVCSITAAHGLHSKLTGAGGGGCAITLLHSDTSEQKVKELIGLLEKEGFECFQVDIGGEGVSPHPVTYPFPE
jgi:mevalonate kinase